MLHNLQMNLSLRWKCSLNSYLYMQNSPITQFGLIGLGIAIIFLFIKPIIDDVGVMQDELAELEIAVENASNYNRVLSELLSIESSISSSDHELLKTYLPSDIDGVQLISDLDMMAQISGTRVVSASSPETSRRSFSDSGAMSRISYLEMDISLIGSYLGLKRFLTLLERNSYPLEVASLSVNTDENSSLLDEGIMHDYEITLRTFVLE